MRKILLTASSLLLLLVACASRGPTIIANASPDVDFSSFETYGFMQQLSTDRPNGVRTPLSTLLINAMSREMADRGFERSDAPDLLINFFVNTEDRLDIRSVPTSGGPRGSRRGRYSTWRG